jgi:hypothetical protein
MARTKKKTVKKIEKEVEKVDPKKNELQNKIQNHKDKIIEQAKLIAYGKVRNVWELEKNARALDEAEKELLNF